MSRPTLEMADLVRAQGDRFLDRYRSSFSFQQLKAFCAIRNCRTAALGGHLDSCSRCGYQAISYNSCRDRHCPKCQTQARQRWVSAQADFFLPISVLRKVFRGKFIAGLKRLRQLGKLCRSGPAALFADPKQFAKLLRRLHLRRWVVYAKAPFGGQLRVLRYLGRYTHRVAISNHRLLAFDGERVSFQWKDYAHGSTQKVMTLAATEFLRRFFLHILPKGFVRIRSFGFLANRFRTQSLVLCRQLLAVSPPELTANREQAANWHCPRCGARMEVRQSFTAAELLRRCPILDSS
ncbi:MAG TPA: transposase [Bryobacteraceae bacterium]|nr:transposase [Bryobacteraceae bacterium]